MIALALRAKLRQMLQPVFRLLKWKRYCKMSLNGLDEKLEKYLDFKAGVFLEAGANNGMKQSNTYYLEAVKGWRGILVEPVPDLYQKCLRNRKSAKVYNAALVSSQYTAETVQLSYADLMTVVKDTKGSADHVARAREVQHLSDTYDFEATAHTLDSIIEDAGFAEIDLLSLDLEGYEVEALQGLDLCRNGPRFILVEVQDLDAILEVIGQDYRQLDVLTKGSAYSDILFEKKNSDERSVSM